MRSLLGTPETSCGENKTHQGEISPKHSNSATNLHQFRDGKHDNWTSLKIHKNDIIALRSQMAHGNDKAAQDYTCSHCNKSLHGRRMTSCPWKKNTAANIETEAIPFMLRMSDGTAAAKKT